MSKIEVDQVTQQSGTTVTVGGGACKTAVVDATTVTIGRSGGTVSLASGASQSGFGRSGSVNWQTTKKTTAFTAANGEGYFVDTAASGAVTMTLPASPSAGNIVAVKDYNGNFATANLTIARNGSPINGGNSVDITISTAGASIVLVYVDATQGWVATQDDESVFSGNSFISATGGTITNDGNFKVHTFTGPGTFCVSSVGSPGISTEVSYMIVAGGGAGGRGATGSSNAGAGGGAGGFREGKTPQCTYTSSPLACTSGSNNGITVTAQGYPIVIGSGGTAAPFPANFPTLTPAASGNGNPSSGFSLTSTAGGGGASRTQPSEFSGAPGGSGGGAISCGSGGSGNTPPVSPSQGFDGGGGPLPGSSAGGGGATGVGSTIAAPNHSPTSIGGAGGAGATTSINGASTAFAGGGGGGSGGAACGSQAGGAGGAGGGGAGSANNAGNNTAGTANTGGGGGGGGGENPGSAGKNGGSGIVIIRYRSQ